ncbi:hypothetical protein SAMN02990966_06495 [Rhodospirillales bacterium URHD0017]|nr:hypothetical protein SAMN02990966_06495 [Rhodospirillales bacterium URHD0017]
MDDWLDVELHRRLRKAQRLGIIDAASARYIRDAADVDHADTCPVHRGGRCDHCDVEISIDLPSGGPVFLLTAEGLLQDRR